MNSAERRILLVTCFGHLMSHYNMLVLPALVIPLSGMLDLPMTGVLGLSFWMYLLFGVMALPWGMIGDKWGGKASHDAHVSRGRGVRIRSSHVH